MEISEIKSRLKLSEILTHYHLQPRNNMLLCPWHEDKTASLQVNLEKDFYKCHGCGKTGDVIQFVQDYEKLSKHEALKKCTSLITPVQEPKPVTIIRQPEINSEARSLFLESIFQYFKTALYCSAPAKAYLAQRCLSGLNSSPLGRLGGAWL